jgi:polyisoprenoid-binding protein YceI
MDKLHTLSALAVGLAFTATAQAAEWSVDPAMSSVGFVAEQQGSRFNGRFQSFTAAVNFDPSDPSSGQIIGTVVTDSVNTRDHDRDAALTDRDWFDSANHPEARFESETISAEGDGGFEAIGQLTIKGSTKPATLIFTFDTSGSGAALDGKIVVDRFEFNVGEGWNDTSWVSQNVEVEVKLSLSN